MNNKNLTENRKSGFTLVELVVVISILAILATVTFISYSYHLVGSRNTNRISQLNILNSGLEVFGVKNLLPNPENNVEIKANGSIIGYQGVIGKNILAMIEYSKSGKDPKDDKYFTYYVSEDKKSFQLMAFLENDGTLQIVENTNLVPKTYATDYNKRFLTVTGKKLGILTEDATNLPIQEVDSVVANGYVDIVSTTNSFKATFTDVDSITGTGLTLLGLEKHVLGGGNLTNSCKNLLLINSKLKDLDGVYFINLEGNNIMSVYCDMTTDEGGWTLIYSAKDDINSVIESNFVGLRTNNYLTISKIKLLANISSEVYIKDDTGGYVRTVTTDSRPIVRLRNGLTINGGYGFGVDNTVSWTGNKISNLLWVWSNPDCYNPVNESALPAFYRACNNGDGSHLGTTVKSWTSTGSINIDIMIK